MPAGRARMFQQDAFGELQAFQNAARSKGMSTKKAQISNTHKKTKNESGPFATDLSTQLGPCSGDATPQKRAKIYFLFRAGQGLQKPRKGSSAFFILFLLHVVAPLGLRNREPEPGPESDLFKSVVAKRS